MEHPTGDRPANEDQEGAGVPAFLSRSKDLPSEPAPDIGAAPPEAFQEDDVSPGQAKRDETRQAERELERAASGAAADDILGSNGKPILVGDIASVSFGTAKKGHQKSGTLLALDGTNARVRLSGDKDPLGEIFPVSRVSTEPVNGGKPLKTRGEKKIAATHADHMSQYREAMARGDKPIEKASTTANDDESAPLPKRVLKSHNTQTSDLTIYRHLGVIRNAKSVLETARGKLRDAWKKAQDDGVNKKALDTIMKELAMSPDEVIAETNTLNAYRGSVSLPAAAQIEEAEEPDRGDQEYREGVAEAEGARAGFRGAGLDSNPYPDPTDRCHQVWADSWHEAQRRLGERFKAKSA